MIKLYSFLFTIEPKAFADTLRFTKKGIGYKPKKNTEYMTKAMMSFYMSHPYKEGTFPLDGPLLASWIFYFPRIGRNLKTNPEKNLHHATKPDGDNLVKIMQDIIQSEAMSARKSNTRLKRLGLITTDSRISISTIEKVYVTQNQQPKIRLILCPLNQLQKELPLTALLLKALVSES